ncbi:hypothetical protein AFCDBAGC_3554 [Methylobacterium cerastii]|uniref:Uncharacterized protein n=1 Tax=Methylobacterium cerastii TaxID=932741 RepID=A0ABQ4QL90_9HYPH|nr:hypothetical protein AFCDBAGC_3554 [Methylobacterium cerastii]
MSSAASVRSSAVAAKSFDARRGPHSRSGEGRGEGFRSFRMGRTPHPGPLSDGRGDPRIPSPRLRGEGRDALVVAARRQPTVRGLRRRSLNRHHPLTAASASPALPGCTTRCSRASPRPRGEGGRTAHSEFLQESSDAWLVDASRPPRIPLPRLRGEGRDDLVVVAARRQPTVRGLRRVSLNRHRPLTAASASPALPGRTTRCSRASPRVRGEGGRTVHSESLAAMSGPSLFPVTPSLPCASI